MNAKKGLIIWFEVFSFILSSPLRCLGAGIVAVLLFTAVFAPAIAPDDPNELNPIERLSGISFSHPLQSQLGLPVQNSKAPNVQVKHGIGNRSSTISKKDYERSL